MCCTSFQLNVDWKCVDASNDHLRSHEYVKRQINDDNISTEEFEGIKQNLEGNKTDFTGPQKHHVAPRRGVLMRSVRVIHTVSVFNVRASFSTPLLSLHHRSGRPTWRSANSKRGWERAGPLVRRSVHISQPAHDNSCLVPAQGQACNRTQYVTRREEEEESRGEEGVFWDVSQCIIAHRANRLPMTRSGCGLLLTGPSFLVWCGCGDLGLSPTEHVLHGQHRPPWISCYIVPKR